MSPDHALPAGYGLPVPVADLTSCDRELIHIASSI